MDKRLVATAISLMVLASLACVSSTPPAPGTSSYAYATFTPSPGSENSHEASYAAAQATLTAGQNRAMELSHQATVVSLDMEQAAAIAAQATIDYDQRRMMELSIEATEVSLNMSRAAATQQFIQDQAQLAQNATTADQSQAATATAQSQAATVIAHNQAVAATATAAHILRVTETAQAQAILVGHAAETRAGARHADSLSVDSHTARRRPAYIVRTREGRERRALWGGVPPGPPVAVLTTWSLSYSLSAEFWPSDRLMPVLEYRLRNPRGSGNASPLSPSGSDRGYRAL